jgi:hypothetical protein
MSCKLWCCSIALVGAISGVQLVNAAVFVGAMHEPFAYPNGTLFPNPPPGDGSLNGGQGWNASGTTAPNAANASWAQGGLLYAGAAAGTDKTATAPGLTSSATGYLAASGNKLTLDAATPNATQNMGRILGGQTIDTGTTYFSYLTSKNNDTIRTINLAFFNGTSERFAVGQIATGTGNTAGNIGLLMNNQNPAGLVQAPTPIAYDVGLTHLIAGRIDWNAAGFETVTLWVDPANVTSEAAAGAAYVSTSAFELIALTGIRPFVGNTTAGFNGVSANFDEIRIGGTWESVTSAAVPAPAAGDYNGNGVVDAADYVVWRDNEGTTNPLPNDPIGGTIGSEQYIQWRSHFGQSASSGAALPSAGSLSVAVPEPATFVSLILAATGALIKRNRVRGERCQMGDFALPTGRVERPCS